MTAPPRRTVRLDPGYDTSNYIWFQANYLHPLEKRLFPSTDVYVGDELVFQSNSYGCKGGDEPEPRAKLIGFFGDSVVQGGNMASFVDHVCIPGFAALNCGIEGSTLRPTIARFLDFQARFPMECVALHTGWHNLIYDETGEDFWSEQLDRIEGPRVIAHFTLAADINPSMIEAGYDHLFREGVYWPWMESLFADKTKLYDFYERTQAFNAFIKAYCACKGRVLIDLEPVLSPKSFTEVSTKFSDLIHPRPRFYPLIGAAITAELAKVLAPETIPPKPLSPGEARRPTSALPQTGRNYPLW